MNPLNLDNGTGSPANILVVDDTLANLQLLAGMLKDRGYKVRPVPSGKLALIAARREPPDLILLDINMPEMNGYEVCRHLKADDQLKGIPVIYISALNETLDKVKAFASGGVDYLTKPFQMEELHARVETHLKLRRLQLELEAYQDYDSVTLDPHGNITNWNPGAERSKGYTAREIIGRHFSCFYTAQDVAKCCPEIGLQTALREGRFEEDGLRVRKDGSTFWVHATITSVHDSVGRHIGFANVTRDISARKQTEGILQLRDRAIEALIQGLCITDPTQPDNPIIYVNESFLKLTGYSREEVIGKNCRFLRGPKTSMDTVERVRSAVREERSCLVELLSYRKDGTLFWNGLSISPILDASGRAAHFVGVMTDVSPLKLLEQQFYQAQKMEAVGQLAGGVAHDFNNLLTIINGYSDLLLESLPSGDPSRELVAEIHKAGDRSAGLTRQLLAFSRQQILATRVLDLNAIVMDTEKMLRRLIGEDVRLTTGLEPCLWSVLADTGQIEQILMNLVVNARDAMPTGGAIKIETHNVVLDERYVELNPNSHAGPQVELSVTDTGCGMTSEVKSRIFEPFFTTKGPGKGTGLGLATVFGIVKQSGGHIAVTSEIGHGTTFRVYLPQVENKKDGLVKGGSVFLPPSRGTETVLLVEDEDGVRALTRHVLVGRGYTVLEAVDGEEAIQLATGHASRIHLLITDVVMPGVGGQAVADSVAALHPLIRVLFVSGYTDDAIIRHGVLREGVNFLQKPFSPTGLANKAREILDAPIAI